MSLSSSSAKLRMLIALSAVGGSIGSLGTAADNFITQINRLRSGLQRRVHRYAKSGRHYDPNGDRERARRIRQMHRENTNRRARLLATITRVRLDSDFRDVYDCAPGTWGLSRRMNPMPRIEVVA